MKRLRRGARCVGGPSGPRAVSRVVAASLQPVSALALALVFTLVLALALACATPQGKTKAKPASNTPVPYQLIAHPVDRATLSPVERRGYDLYVRELAASRATNAALTAIAERERTRSDIVGWIVVPYEQGLLTRFMTREGRAAIDVSVDPTSALPPFVILHDPARAVPEREQAMWRARELAVQQPIARCSDRYNTVILPESDRDDSDWLVYLIAVPMEPTRFAVGGHQRIRVDATGTRILEQFALSKSCLSPEYDPASPGFVVTHLVSREPVETHVYLSLLHGITLYVGVAEPKQLFKVENGRIERVED